MDYAEALGCGQVNCLAGLKPQALPSDVAFETLVDNLRFAADLFAAKGLTLTWKRSTPGDMPGFLVDTSAMAMAVIEAAGAIISACNTIFIICRSWKGICAVPFATLSPYRTYSVCR